MRSVNEWTLTARCTALCCTAAVIGSMFFSYGASAGERKYLVMLASSPKQYPTTGTPPGGFINKELIRRQYFQENPNDNIGSFAEYWEEISYGDVTISGRVTDWLLLPWPVQPALMDVDRNDPTNGPPVGDNPDDLMLRLSPDNFLDVDEDGFFTYGVGEAILNGFGAVIVDLDGDPGGMNNGPLNPPPGSSHTAPNSGHPVWKPGERFLDMDNDNKWDGLDEANNWSDYNNDGLVDLPGPWVDYNGDGIPQAPDMCVFLPDSDNDTAITGGFTPDCCPDGPDGPATCDCPPTIWTTPDGMFTDCNGDMMNDQVGEGGLPDGLPFVVGENGQCGPGEGDGIPDACQFPGIATCRDPNINCDDPGPCCNLQPCPAPVNLMIPVRCEYFDTNNNMMMDVVEPFENFTRRWDPCMFDPDVSVQNFQQSRTHWIKNFDPNSDSTASCAAPAGMQVYSDPSYIMNNYPGGPAGAADIIAESGHTIVFGMHDPLGMGGANCTCADGTACQTIDGVAGLCVAGIFATYNPPDSFDNTVASAKFRALPGGGGQARFAAATPEPGTYPSVMNPQDTPWYQQAWMDRYQVEADQVPAWPPGYMEFPGGGGMPMANSLMVGPYRDPEPEGYDPMVNRRFFKANFGGLNGDGTGWLQQCGNLSPVIVFETGPLGQLGFETACNRPILPEEVNGMNTPGVFFDGVLEYDDLPSSKYHKAGDMYLGEITSPFRTWYNENGSGLGFPGSVDPMPGEGDNPSRKIPAIWGEDRGDNIPTTPDVGGGDQILLAAGPYSQKLYGSQGHDAGNQLFIELLTWRTAPPFNNGFVWETWYGTHHPYAGPGTPLAPNENLGFRDYNLDGLIDMGETRPAGSENYLSDSDPTNANNGTQTNYPFNRQRMLEDCVMILDEGLDFDDFVDDVVLDTITCGSGIFPTPLPVQFITPDMEGNLGADDFVFADGLCSGIVLLANGSHAPNQFPLSPSFYPIHNEDGLGDPEFQSTNYPRNPSTPQIAWNIFFHDLVIAVDQTGEDTSGGISNANFQTPYSAHEYLHCWEGFPDLYDYDVFSPPGPLIHFPIGFWDIMANGGLVHPTPVLKEKPCTEWMKPVDLATVLTPGISTPVTLPPYELVRDDSAFFFENENRLGERYYFYSVGEGFDDPDPLPIIEGMPATGMLVLYTNVGANPEALPLQQQNPPFTYQIIAADGLDEGGGGVDQGDDGDTWPGSTNNTRFDCNTNPASRWNTENTCTGLTVENVVPDNEGSVLVTFNWTPTSLPSIKFIDPPGGASVNVAPGIRIYNIRSEVTDVFGGTWVRVFRSTTDSDRTIDPNGSNYVGILRKTSPGTDLEVLDWNIAGIPDDQYHLFAELVPGSGADGDELSFTAPRAGRNNNGNGTLTIDEVETNRILASGLVGMFPTNSTFTGSTETGDPVNFTGLGVQVNDQLATNALIRAGNGGTERRGVLRTITGVLNGGTTLQLSSPITPPPGIGGTVVTSWLVTDAPRDARSEAWVAECTNAAGTDWKVFSSLTQPQPPSTAPNQDPYPHATTGQLYTSVNGAVKFTINAGSVPYTVGDRFTFVTTGISAHSGSVTVLTGVISETPVAVITAAPLSGDPPLLVNFDGRASFDPDGQPLTYRWDFGDGTPVANQDVVNHIFQEGGQYTVVLRVTNPDGLFGEAQVDVNVTNNTPNAVIRVNPASGLIGIRNFDGSLSTDFETQTADLIYEWNFGDGFSAGPGEPGDFQTTQHFYGQNGVYTASLRVTDEGGRQDTDTIQVIVGNTLPIASVTYTTLQGPTPHQVTFNGINSSDPDNDPITILWIWGDGTPNSGPYPRTGPPGTTTGAVPHTYALPAGQTAGTFNTTAMVCDNRTPPGCVTWPGVTVTVSQAGVGASDPRAIFTVMPNPPVLNQPATFNGTLSFDRPAGSLIASYSWNFGDGSTGSGVIATHTYTQPGTYTARLTVADGDNPPHTNTEQFTFTVTSDGGVEPPDPDENRPPTAIISVNPLQGIVGETEFTFDARSSNDLDGDTLTYSWTFGDGESAEGSLVTHVFEELGDFQARLTVRDSDNATATAVQSVSVLPVGTNRNPIARIATGLRTGSVPVTFTFDGRTSFDPDGDPLSYEWQFLSDGEVIDTKTGSVVSRLFDQEGVFEVVLNVSDGREGIGSTDPERVTVTARSVPPIDGGGPEQPSEQDVGDSADQRPPTVCGLGMMMAFFGSLVGLSAMAVSRRRFRM